MTTLTEILKRLESRAANAQMVVKDWCKPEIHGDIADHIYKDQALIRTLIEVVRLQDEALLEWIVSGYAENLEPTYTHTKEARERALTLLREMKNSILTIS